MFLAFTVICDFLCCFAVDASTDVAIAHTYHTVSLPCHTNLTTAVDWTYKQSAETNEVEVCVSGRVRSSYKDRFSIVSPSAGVYNLVISNVQSTDEGKYTCIEDAGVGRRHPIQLHVIGKCVII